MLAALLALAIALSIWNAAAANSGIADIATAGSTSSEDRIDIAASIQKVDAASGEIQLRLKVTPRGALTSDGGLSPEGKLELLTSPAVKDDLTFPAQKRIATVDTLVSIDGSAITAYPFDSYQADIEFAARSDGESVPVHLILSNRDALYSVDATASTVGDTAIMELGIGRSAAVIAFAVFMVLAMWALCAAVIIGTRFVIGSRKGLVWPALSWMAATLFALVAFRNAAPGAPPIGSAIDYVAFFWTEAIIAACVLATVVSGRRAEATG